MAQCRTHSPAKVRPEAMSSQARQIRHKPTPAGAFSDLGSVVSQQQRARHQASLERKQQQNARVPSVKPALSESARDTHPHHPYAGAGARWHHTTALPAERPKRATFFKRPPTTQRVQSNLQICRGTPQICRCMHACQHACGDSYGNSHIDRHIQDDLHLPLSTGTANNTLPSPLRKYLAYLLSN